MKKRFSGIMMAAALLAGAGVAGAATKANPSVPRTDAELAKQVRHEIVMYPRYSIWDDLSFRVENGQVELMGAVNQPWKKADIQRLVQRVEGVTAVTNRVKVLPLSPNDDRIRLQVARAIYRDPVLSRYSIQAVPPIHIIVENGHVTLTGVVNNEMEKNVAGIRASGASLSFGPVVNNLRVENPSKKG
jgi:hyperosmotically inducible protein